MSQSPGYMAAYNNRRRFGGNKQEALEASKGACVMCGGPAVLVHHRDGNKRNHARDNLMALCRACHARIHTKERMAAMTPEQRTQFAANGRAHITPEIARKRAFIREQRKRERRFQCV